MLSHRNSIYILDQDPYPYLGLSGHVRLSLRLYISYIS